MIIVNDTARSRQVYHELLHALYAAAQAMAEHKRMAMTVDLIVEVDTVTVEVGHLVKHRRSCYRTPPSSQQLPPALNSGCGSYIGITPRSARSRGHLAAF